MKMLQSCFIKLFARFTLLVLLLSAVVTCAQEAKKIDSVLKKANVLVYEDPDEAIKTAGNIQAQYKLTTKQQTDALLTIAGAYSAKSYNQKAIDYGLKAYKLASAGNSDKDQVRALGFIGNQYYFLKMHDKVNLYLDMAEQIMDSKIPKDSLRFIKGNVYFVKGVNYKDKLDCDVAVSYFDKAIAEYVKTNDNNSSSLNLSIALIQKGLCLTDQLRLDDARVILLKARGIAFTNGYTENGYFADIALAKTYYAENDFKGSNTILFKIEKDVDQFHGLTLQSEFYQALADNFLKLKDYGNYNIYSTKFLKLKTKTDSLEMISFHNLINEISVDKKNAVKKQNRDENIYYAIACFLFLATGGFLFFKFLKVIKSLRNSKL